MLTKIIKLVTGEELVCKLSDLLDENENKIGFKIHFPYRIVMRPTTSPSGEAMYDINYIAWMSGSSDSSFDLSYSSVVAIGSPVPEVDSMYQERYNEYLNMIDQTDVQQ